MAVARFALGLVLAGSTGCSLVSGWSDLQGGSPAASDGDGGAPDGGTSSSGGDASGADAGGQGGTDSGVAADSGGGSSGEDSGSSSADASTVVMTVLCGGQTRCPIGEGCCAALPEVGTSTCQAPTAPCNAPDAFEQCSDSSQCRGLSPTAVCCSGEEGAGQLFVSCTETCTPTGNGIGSIVCDPTLPSPSCPAGKTCQPDSDFNYDTCQ